MPKKYGCPNCLTGRIEFVTVESKISLMGVTLNENLKISHYGRATDDSTTVTLYKEEDLIQSVLDRYFTYPSETAQSNLSVYIKKVICGACQTEMVEEQRLEAARNPLFKVPAWLKDRRKESGSISSSQKFDGEKRNPNMSHLWFLMYGLETNRLKTVFINKTDGSTQRLSKLFANERQRLLNGLKHLCSSNINTISFIVSVFYTAQVFKDITAENVGYKYYKRYTIPIDDFLNASKESLTYMDKYVDDLPSINEEEVEIGNITTKFSYLLDTFFDSGLYASDLVNVINPPRETPLPSWGSVSEQFGDVSGHDTYGQIVEDDDEEEEEILEPVDEEIPQIPNPYPNPIGFSAGTVEFTEDAEISRIARVYSRMIANQFIGDDEE